MTVFLSDYTHSVVPNSPLPLATSLEDIYTESSLPSQNKRWSQLSEHFVREYGMKPQKCARAPGRVNVMGECTSSFAFARELNKVLTPACAADRRSYRLLWLVSAWKANPCTRRTPERPPDPGPKSTHRFVADPSPVHSSVLPAAIERDVLIAFATTSAALPANVKAPQPTKAGRSVIVLRNVEREKYTDTHFEVDLDSWGGDLPLPKTHHWSSYFIAGTKVRAPSTRTALYTMC